MSNQSELFKKPREPERNSKTQLYFSVDLQVKNDCNILLTGMSPVQPHQLTPGHHNGHHYTGNAGQPIHYQYHPAQTTGTVNMVGKTLKVLPPVSSPMQQVIFKE